MTTLVFEMADINKLIEEIRTPQKRFRSPQIRSMTRHAIRGSPSLTLRDRLKKRRVKLVGFSFPSSSKLPAHIWCQKCFSAHSHGVYLITNAELEGSPASRDTVAYAQGMNPKLDEDWDYACDAALGGSDCSYTIPVEWLELAVEQGFQEFRLPNE